MIELGVGGGPDRTERRNYESLVVAGMESAAVGVLVPVAVAAVEAAASTWARAFGAAEVEGGRGAITPQVLASIGRRLIRAGEAVHLIDVDLGGRVRLLDVAQHTVLGGPSPDSWRYRVSLAGPSATSYRVTGADGVVHCRYSVDGSAPWIGRGPLSWATSTGRLTAAIERALADESAGPVGHLIALPQDAGGEGDEDKFAALKRDIRELRGKAALVETSSAGWGEGRAAAPARDWLPQRLGANPPAALVELRRDVAVSIASACGLPPALAVEGADGTAQRESWRRFLHGSVQPIARMVEAELSEKLDEPVVLSFRRLEAGDVTGRARAWRSLVGKEATMDDATARRVAGLDG